MPHHPDAHESHCLLTFLVATALAADLVQPNDRKSGGQIVVPDKPPAESIPVIPVKAIWDMSRITDRKQTRMELTDLIRFKENWYCGFREGEIHNNHPSRSRRTQSRRWENKLIVPLVHLFKSLGPSSPKHPT